LPFKIIPQENFHITLAFLGLVSEEQQEYLVKLISEKHIDIHRKINNFTQGKNANLDAVHLTLSKLGCFNRAQVLHFMPANCPRLVILLSKNNYRVMSKM
jgi:2'-5' RNA ligase